jgi:uncharacterized RDD family membrane protein YckC
MRCPKCHYISFESGQRCRNCGYDFSLAVESRSAGPADLPIAVANAPEGPLGDFVLEAARPVPPRAPDTASDLPLFSRAVSDRAAVPPPTPRPPLAVRRPAPVLPRPRPAPVDEPTLDLSAPEGIRAARARNVQPPEDAAEPVDTAMAPLGRRIAAGLLDAILMGSIHAAVIYLTLRLCGLTTQEVRVLPPVPLAAFLLMLTSGYLVSFTVAGGQTIGKMIAGIRVVPLPERDPGNARVTLGSALVRAAGCLLSLLAAGLGYVPALLGQDRRAFHDRLAETRVVRA